MKNYSWTPVHFYSKGIDGNVIFYTRHDYLVFLTLFCSIAKRKKKKILAFCIMPNHFHYLELTTDSETAVRGMAEFERQFAKIYNREYGRTGKSLFVKRSGKAIKATGKLIRSCIIYIYNNPTVGKLSRTSEEYRWNLIAYRNSAHPFSEKLNMSTARKALRDSINMVNTIHDSGSYLSYAALRRLFLKLNEDEAEQLTDYIIYRYDITDYDEINKIFGSPDNAVAASKAVAGSEYDIAEDFENHSLYSAMIEEMERCRYNVCCRAIETLNADEQKVLMRNLYERTHAPLRQIMKFLHIAPVECKSL